MWSLPNSSYKNPWARDETKKEDEGGQGQGPWNPFQPGPGRQAAAQTAGDQIRPQPATAATDDEGSQRSHGVSLAEPPHVFPELEEKTSSELEVLLHDPETFNALVCDHEYKQKIAAEVEHLRTEVRELREVIDRKLNEGPSTDLHSQLSESQKIEADLQKEIAEKEAKREHYLEKNSPEAMHHRLIKAVQEADDNSMKLKHNFLNGEIEFDTFKKAFIAERRLFHARSAKSIELESLLGRTRH